MDISLVVTMVMVTMVMKEVEKGNVRSSIMGLCGVD